ncbi:FG-GAP repeat domain-containing protein [Sphingobacterium sp. Mn56C]|uniref:FG-GAP repeat domain-containing protein n=1 Tax=Sphingobacterium sp. Mn56C TaxID=3395261 RepID=UPI003BE63B0E
MTPFIFPVFSMCICTFLCCTACLAQTKNTETRFFSDVTTTHLPLDEKTHALDVALADFNRDGHLDIVLALESQPNRLYLNDGTGRFTWVRGVFLNANHDTEHVRVGDFDGDGLLDVIFVAEDDQNHEFYLGNGDGTFKNVSDRLLGKSEANGLAIGDVNNDGLLDVVIGNSGDKPANFLWLNNKDNPGFFINASSRSLPPHLDQTQSVKLVDVNNDGFLDMVIGNEVAPNRLYFNDGKGNFYEKEGALPQTVPLHTREVIAFDANADGQVDLLFANLASNGGGRDNDPRARLFINQGDGFFKDETEKRIPNFEFSTYAAHSIDYNRDGAIDIILSAIMIPPFQAYQVQALKNDGNGYFTLVTDSVIPESTYGRSWGIAVGDVNNDGIPDLVIGAWGDQVRLLLGK